MAKGGHVRDRDHGYRELLSNLRDLKHQDGRGVFVGIHGREGSEVVIIAASNEFGTADGRVPERSYLRSTVAERESAIADALERAVLDAVDGKAPLERGLGLLGEEAVGWVKTKIRTLKHPPNAPSTIRRKGADNPLIENGQTIRNRIGWTVE